MSVQSIKQSNNKSVINQSIFPGDPTEMMVTWSTFNDTKDSVVEFGFHVEDLSMTATGSRTKFVDGGSEKRTQYIHRVKLTGLKTGSVYCKYTVYIPK